MDSTPDVLAERVRAKRTAIDNDLELLRLKTERAARLADPRRLMRQWGPTAVPIALGATALWMWSRRRRAVTSLQDLLAEGVADLHGIEQQLVPILERFQQAATNPDLAALFARHAEESRVHLERLARVLRSIGVRTRRPISTAVSAIDGESQRFLRRRTAPEVRDAWLIATTQRIEHLEIAEYGTTRTFAETLGYTYASELLQQTLEDERAMDQQLSNLARRFVNPKSIR
jgi:ferritin-like metal-binding protein YciE